MSTQLHELIISNPSQGTETFQWNGDPEDRAKAEAIFKERMDTDMYLAYKTVEVEDTAGGGTTTRKEQIRRDEFDAEAEKTWLAPRLVGG